jgi:hypothetical protein
MKAEQTCCEGARVVQDGTHKCQALRETPTQNRGACLFSETPRGARVDFAQNYSGSHGTWRHKKVSGLVHCSHAERLACSCIERRSSALRSFPFAFAAEMSAGQCSSGTRLRCRHFLTVSYFWPMSVASVERSSFHQPKTVFRVRDCTSPIVPGTIIPVKCRL